MKKFTLFAALFFATAFSFAQITEGTIGQGSFTNYSGTTSTCYGIDFNNDGVLEIAIKENSYDYEGNECGYGNIEYSDSKIQIVAGTESWDVFLLLNEGSNISSSNNFSGYGDAYFYNFNDVSTAASYVGFRWTNNSQNYYAYAKVHRNGNNIVWDKVYYNATAGTAITVGATPTGIEKYTTPTPAATIRKVVIGGVLYIERGDELYELTGRRIK